MINYLVQVTLGQNFADLSVVAAAARALVKSDPSLALFRHRFANFIL